MKKALIIGIIALIVVVLAVGIFSTPASAATTEFAGGSGTEADPYLISTKEQLNNLRNYANGTRYFKLTADIEFSDDDFAPGGLFYNNGKGWRAIGESWRTPFSATFDGNGYSIVNLQIYDALDTDQPTGLFGYNSGTIKNLTISNSHISTKIYPSYLGCIAGQNDYEGIIENCSITETEITSSAGKGVGGIVGYNNGVIRNCTNLSEITVSTASNVGGICGINYGSGFYLGIIQNCSNSGTITLGAPSEQGACVGGIAGKNFDDSIIEYSHNVGNITVNSKSALIGGITGENFSTIQQCYNTGIITTTTSGNLYAGGLIGYNVSGIVTNSYNTSTITGKSNGYSGDVYVGGIIGKNQSISTTSNCYTIGTVSGEGSTSATYVGYVCGYNSTNTIDNCYYLGVPNNGAGFGDYSTMYGNNSDALKKQSTYVGFDFENVWEFKANNLYPYPTLINNPYFEGDVAGDDTESNLRNKAIEDAISGTTLTTDVVGEETVIIVPTSQNVAMTEDELSAIFNDASITITSNNGVIGTGCKVTIGEYMVDLVVKGDVDGDGVATVFDALMVKKALANNGFENEALREFAADVDGTDGTTEADVDALLEIIVGKNNDSHEHIFENGKCCYCSMTIVPNVVGMTKELAKQTLENAGFVVTITSEYSNTVAAGNVISQTPSSGDAEKEGSTVTITVSLGKLLVNVPNVVGMTKEQAKQTLENAGFVVTITSEYSNTVAAGNVISQTPSSGDAEKEGSTVTITVSLGELLVNVPNVVGMTKELAKQTLENAGFVVTITSEYSNTVAADNVISQTPSSGTSQKKGSTISVVVSLGVNDTLESNFTYTVSSGKATITGFNKNYSGKVIIPQTLGGYPVTTIGTEAFSDCTNLTSVIIPDNVTSIGEVAFAYCSNLTSVTIPNSVTTIGDYAFLACSSLTSISIPDSVTVIAWGAFCSCTKLTSITIPNGITSIIDNTFADCSSLTSINIPNSVTSIGHWAFYNCNNLTTVHYNGTGEEWNGVSIGDFNEPLMNANIICYYD